MSENNASKGNIDYWNWKSIGFLFPIAPVLGYTLAYVHELGYCNEFKIPRELIVLDWNTIIIGISAAFGGSLILLWFVFMLMIPKEKKKLRGPIQRRLYFLAILTIVVLLVSVNYLMAQEIIYPILYLFMMAVVLFVIPLFDKTVKDQKGYRNKLKKYDENQKKTEEPLLRRFSTVSIVILMLLIGAFSSSFLDGRIGAKNQDEFLVPSTYPNTVILRIYGDNIICAPVDFDKKEIERAYFIIRVDDEPRPMLIPVKTGRLHVPELSE